MLPRKGARMIDRTEELQCLHDMLTRSQITLASARVANNAGSGEVVAANLWELRRQLLAVISKAAWLWADDPELFQHLPAEYQQSRNITKLDEAEDESSAGGGT